MPQDQGQAGGAGALHCPTCGYDLTGLPKNRCPECGNAFSRSDPFCHPEVIRYVSRRQKLLLVLQLVAGPLLIGILTTTVVALASSSGRFMLILSQVAAVLLCISLGAFSWTTASNVDHVLALRACGRRGSRPSTIIVFTILLIPINFLLGLPVVGFFFLVV